MPEVPEGKEYQAFDHEAALMRLAVIVSDLEKRIAALERRLGCLDPDEIEKG